MTNSQRLAAVRTALCKWIAEHAPQEGDGVRPLSEAMLIREGFFCGRRFRFQLYHAVWFLEEDEVKILGLDGTVAGRLDSAAIDHWARAGNDATAEPPQTLSIAAHRETTPAAAAEPPQNLAERSQEHPLAQRRAA